MSAPGIPSGSLPEVELGDPDAIASTSDIQAAAVRGSGWTAIQAVIGLPLSVLVNLVVAHSLGPHGYGVLASYMTAYTLLVALLNAGITDATIQWGAAAYARRDRKQLIELSRRCAGYHMFIQGPLASLVGLALLHRETWPVQVAGAVAIALAMFLGTTLVVMTSISMSAPLAKLSLTVGSASQLAVITAAVASHSAGPTWVARLGVATLVPLAALLIAPRDVRKASLSPRLPRNWPKGFSRYAFRTLLGGLVTALVFSRSELLLLDAYGDQVAAGLFALAAGLAVQITAPVDALLGPLIPAAASLMEIGRDRAASAVLRGMRLTALATAPIVLLVVPAIAVLVPEVYGGRFRETGALFIGLGIVSCLQSVLHPVTAFVIALRKPLVVLALNGGALLVDLALVATLVPSFGAAGAVWGNCVGQVLSLAGSIFLLHRYIGLDLASCGRAMAPFGAVCIVVAAVSSAEIALHPHTVVVSVVVSIGTATVVSYAAVRLLGGIATDSDLAGVVDNLPKILRPALAMAKRAGLVRASDTT